MDILGVDIGGTGIKAALVDTGQGVLTTERERILTPQPSTPEAVIGVIQELVKHFAYVGPIGVGYPGVILNGATMTAANLDQGWLNFPGAQAIGEATGCPVSLINDADAAGLAEMRFGAGRDKMGVVLILTLGTGIGSALFVDGRLVPNTELGHLYLPGRKKDAEFRASERARIEKNLTWPEWAANLDEYLHYVERLFSPNLFILGGGGAKKAHKFLPLLTVRAPVIPAALGNEAGIVGAAMAAV